VTAPLPELSQRGAGTKLREQLKRHARSVKSYPWRWGPQMTLMSTLLWWWFICHQGQIGYSSDCKFAGGLVSLSVHG